MRSLTKAELEVICGGYDSNQVSTVYVTPGNTTSWWPSTTYTYTNSGGGGAPSAGDSGTDTAATSHPDITEVAEVIVQALKDTNWSQVGVDANELLMKVTGGYDGETVDTNTMNTITSINGVTIYSSDSGHLYADRDGDGVIDTGLLFNTTTGVVSADFDTNGTGDQVIVDLW